VSRDCFVPAPIDSASRRRLEQAALAVASSAYAPYSGFRVGAAVQCRDGRVFTGANVENGSAGAGLCAERTALATALSEGERDFDLLVVAFANTHNVPEGGLVPCGICLQWLAELAPRALVLVANSGRIFALSDLLPHAFRLRAEPKGS
jgi:cytidine deaminase